MPPQEGKSTRVARDFPLWYLQRRPLARLAIASYGEDLAVRNGKLVRNAIANNPQLGLTLASGDKAVRDWRLGNGIGGVRSVGIGGGITGHAVDLLIIDDPIKSQAEADSKTYRESVWEWWRTEAASRLSPGAPVVLILTRWHHDDLAGRLLSEPKSTWRLLNIPAQAEATDDILGRAPGEFMLSTRGRTAAEWEIRKAEAGSRTWAALYQGHPSPSEGGMFARDRWRTWNVAPNLAGAIVCQSWDMAFKGTDNSDYVVGQVWAKIGADLYLLDQVRGRWGFAETCQQMLALTAKWPQAVAKLVEDTANGPAVMDALKGQIGGLIPVTPQGGKVSRAAAASALQEAGNIHLPAAHAAPWVGDLIEEAAAFPSGTHDDQVDALTQAVTRLALAQTQPDYVGNY